MATQSGKPCGVGEINDLVKLLDEYQLQVPNRFKKVWKFDTIAEADEFSKACQEKGLVLDGHKYKVPALDSKKNKILDKDGNQVYKPVPGEDGKLSIIYCPVGEMVVRCIEKAAKMMDSPVMITGEYLTGANWGQCH